MNFFKKAPVLFIFLIKHFSFKPSRKISDLSFLDLRGENNDSNNKLSIKFDRTIANMWTVASVDQGAVALLVLDHGLVHAR